MVLANVLAGFCRNLWNSRSTQNHKQRRSTSSRDKGAVVRCDRKGYPYTQFPWKRSEKKKGMGRARAEATCARGSMQEQAWLGRAGGTRGVLTEQARLWTSCRRPSYHHHGD